MRPARFLLEGAQVSAALAHAGIARGERSPLPPGRADAGALRGSELVDSRGVLTPEADAALRIAADPVQITSITATRAGDQWGQWNLLRGRGRGALVAYATMDDRIDIALLPSTAEALLMLDERLALTDLASRSGDRTWSLDLAGYAALLAAADLLLATRLETRLARRSMPIPNLTPEALRIQIAKGTNASDTRWAVTAGGRIAPVSLAVVEGRMAQGIASLVSAGLAAAAAHDIRLTEPGYLAATMLGELVTAAGLEQFAFEDGSAQVARVTLFRTTLSIWAATWDAIETADARLSLAELNAAAALVLMRSLLEPVAAEPTTSEARDAAEPAGASSSRLPRVRTCAGCGRPVPLSARFCPACGKPVP